MNKRITTIVCFLALMPLAAQGKATMGGISRGGLGFLFSDTNSFANPGQASLTHGFALEGEYVKIDKSSIQGVETSAVWGNGHVGFGAFGDRTGVQLNQPASDTDLAGAELGFSFAKDRLTLGVGYSAVISSAPPNKGTLDATFNYNPMGERGFAAGVGATTNFKPSNGARTTQTATVAMGYSFRHNNSLEFYGRVNDLANAKNDAGGLALTLGAPAFYLGTSAQYNRLASNYEVAARMGFIIAQVVDLSVLADKVLQTGSATLYGGAIRAAF